jgi:hypothetical protein
MGRRLSRVDDPQSSSQKRRHGIIDARMYGRIPYAIVHLPWDEW